MLCRLHLRSVTAAPRNVKSQLHFTQITHGESKSCKLCDCNARSSQNNANFNADKCSTSPNAWPNIKLTFMESFAMQSGNNGRNMPGEKWLSIAASLNCALGLITTAYRNLNCRSQVANYRFTNRLCIASRELQIANYNLQ